MAKRELKNFSTHPINFEVALEKGMFRAICNYVVDGDTADFLIDLGWYHYSYLPIRFKDIDTPELRGVPRAEKKLGEQAKARVEELILDKPVLIQTSKDRMSFGRFVGDIWFEVDNPSGYSKVIEILIDGEPTRKFILISELLKLEGFEKQ